MSNTIEVRQASSKSWLDSKYSHVLAAQLSDRLIERCKGEAGLFLTLTYRRKEYDDARDLYRKSSEQRHVRRFIERLSKYLGESLTGKWICKLEFQRGGWVHWHLVILGPSYLDHAALQNMWGHGYVWVNRITKNRIRYTCKYISKGESLPAYLYAEPIRSVKIIRCSPGFWGETEGGGGGVASPPQDRPTRLEGCYVPIGMSIELQQNRTIVREPETGEYSRIEEPVWKVLLDMVHTGSKVTGTIDGWIEVRRARMPALYQRIKSKIPSRSGSPSTRSVGGLPRAERSEALHLINNRKPPIGFGWIDQYLGELFTCQNQTVCEGGV